MDGSQRPPHDTAKTPSVAVGEKTTKDKASGHLGEGRCHKKQGKEVCIMNTEHKNTFDRIMKSSQKGFTLLELLVVVAILAAIAGTATLALQDTDARASAAAHVAMMDELNKGVHTFRVLNKNVYPNNFDSLAWIPDGDTDAAAAALLPNDPDTDDGDILGIEDGISVGEIIEDAELRLAEIGITSLRYVNAATSQTLADPTETVNCTPTGGALQAAVGRRDNQMVAGNIFNSPAANGCGVSIKLSAGDNVAYWTDPVERIIGPGDWDNAAYDASAGAMTGTPLAAGVKAPVLMAVGFGPASNLFNTNELGGMTSVPVYRHVTGNQYNRFIGLFRIGEAEAVAGATSTDPLTWGAVKATDQVAFVGVVDGAGDTKEEELGEWDGTRNTL
ncbi:MAG: prepilin-type N-terminal cleavage/methylation domain-containing protein [Acidobacteriota bacterium]|jgi:prepilin-type N-terminal cleavage/methylation domain-containing protein|nr:prepilin-type N-terminal cleavage/methylation domain-containing protein [Acidobacteriota bacterium]